ncbi:MAG: glycogen/starch/alpha-glucan phosphorylase [Planctomycetota bacterium]
MTKPRNMTIVEKRDSEVMLKPRLPTATAMELLDAFAYHLKFSLAKDSYNATSQHCYLALAMAVRDQMIERWIDTQRTYYQQDVKRIYYFSMEFLMGRMLTNSLMNLGLYEFCRQLPDIGYDLDELEEMEADAGLGNGGLGRLAACFLDSLATMSYPAQGYGIRFDFGIFHQRIRDGYQIEEPDQWLRTGDVWETHRPENMFRVKFGGRVEQTRDAHGKLKINWVDTNDVLAAPFDMPIPGYGGHTVNTLSLWSARAVESFNLEYFQAGDYAHAVEQSALSETLSRVLYPNDNLSQGRELRLKQEYFLVCASLQDIMRRYHKHHKTFKNFPDRVAIQLNDTHPTLAIPELMRLLLDEHSLSWDEAWEICMRTFSYTNHTLMPEALEKWSVTLLQRLLPRHLEIIYEINRRFLETVAKKYPGNGELLQRVSLIEEYPEKMVRMAHLAVVGSHAVNGVARLHTELLKTRLLSDFFNLYPERFHNKTNGVTPRRWLKLCNPGLSELITCHIGANWITDLEQLRKLEQQAEDSKFHSDWRMIKRANKERLAKYIKEVNNIAVDPKSLFTVHIKRLHEYKRQLLNILQVIARYKRIKTGAKLQPRMVLFSGKAAPGYALSKLIIKLINNVALVVNNDWAVGDRLKVVFLADYEVSLAQKIIPAADLSEQISTAGMEASGTGNMKLGLNGALTIGTLDGANVEIREAVGAENFFLFGLTADEIAKKIQAGYNPRQVYESDAELRAVIDDLAQGRFSNGNTQLFRPILDAILERDVFMVLADFRAYMEAQERVDAAYQNVEQWTKSSILNVARLGYFSSDRTIKEYAQEIWNIKPVEPQKGLRT